MPVYDYRCADCGDFTEMRPMAEFDLPHPCPGCGEDASRVILTVPSMAMMDSGQRTAMATNERSRHAPRRGERSHPSNCSCCKPGRSGRTLRADDGSKSFPSSRPWMISH